MKLNAIPIPKRFMLHGQVIEVKYDPNMISFKQAHGESQPEYNSLTLQPRNDGHVIDQSQIEESFFHELMHFIFYHAGQLDAYKDEQVVELTANLLHQAFATAEYK